MPESWKEAAFDSLEYWVEQAYAYQGSARDMAVQQAWEALCHFRQHKCQPIPDYDRSFEFQEEPF